MFCFQLYEEQLKKVSMLQEKLDTTKEARQRQQNITAEQK